MARTVKEEEYTVKREEIIEAAQRQVYTKGDDEMSNQDILDELQILKGALTTTFIRKVICWRCLIHRMLLDVETYPRSPIIN